ncbi:MAG: hypothetical protein ACI4EA_05775 [Candidatus Ornithomonoglobus sp.]
MKCKKLIAAMLTAAAAVGCFCVTAGATVSKTGNLITDGGFDATETSYATTAMDWHFETSNIWHCSGLSNSIVTEDDNTYVSVTGNGVGQRVAVETGKTYILSAKVKSTGSTELWILDGNQAWPANSAYAVARTAISQSDDWQTVTVEYTNNTYSTLVAYLWSDSGVTTCIDDVKLVEVDSAENFDYTADEELEYDDATGFTYTFKPAGDVNKLTWYLKKDSGSYKETETVELPTIMGNGSSTIQVGLVVYHLPEGVTGESLSAGVSIE